MSIKSAGKFDFILATLKVSPICFMMFLELLAVMVCRVTWLHVQGRLACLYSSMEGLEDILTNQVMWDHWPRSQVSSNGKNVLNSSNDTLKIEEKQHLIVYLKIIILRRRYYFLCLYFIFSDIICYTINSLDQSNEQLLYTVIK